MDAIIFLLILIAAIAAIRARRVWVVLLCVGIALGAAAALFLHHATDQLGVRVCECGHRSRTRRPRPIWGRSR